MRTGLFGGAFDPVHYGHLHVARTALEGARLDRVIFLPSGLSPHRHKRTLSPGRVRLDMLRLAVRGEPRFSVSDFELRRGGTSWTIDTVRAFRAELPEDELFFVIGGDSLADLPRWRMADELVREIAFVTVSRPGFDAESVLRSLPFPPPVVAALRKGVIHAPLLDISSTEVRRRAARGESLAGLVPPAVEEYIRRNRIYESEER